MSSIPPNSYQYLEITSSRMIVMVYGHDNHYHIHNKKDKEAEVTLLEYQYIIEVKGGYTKLIWKVLAVLVTPS